MRRPVAVSLTYGILAHTREDWHAGRPQVGQDAVRAVRRMRRYRFALILSSSEPPRGIRTARIDTLFKARLGAPQRGSATFFRVLTDVAECPPEQIIHVDAIYSHVLMALEHGIRAVHLHAHTDPYRPLPPGAAYARTLDALPEVLLHLTMTGPNTPDTRGAPPTARAAGDDMPRFRAQDADHGACR